MPDAPPYRIEVDRADVERFLSTFSVRIVEGDSTSAHTVTLSGADWERLGAGYPSPEAFVEASFAFLLAREPKERILSSFDLTEIGRYFGDYERAMSPPAEP